MLIAHAWHVDIPLCLALLAAVVIYERRRRDRNPWRHRAFIAGILTLAVALASPLDALAASWASAHMVQHLLLTVVAAPLLVIGTPIPRLAHPVAWAALHVVVLWMWHTEWLYEAALRNEVLHRLEHVTFLATAVLSWAAILARGAAGIGVLVLFGLSVQCALLGALMTFATTPWYPTYSSLSDQQLAGVIMWVPGGGAYLVAALAMVMWMIADERLPDAARAEQAVAARPDE